MNSITLEFPMPNALLSPNSKPHSMHAIRKQRKAVKNARHNAQYDTIRQVRNAGLPDGLQWERVWADVKWFHMAWQRPDQDNAKAMLKSLWDGIQDSGLILNDKHLTVESLTFQEDKANPRLEITLTVVIQETT